MVFAAQSNIMWIVCDKPTFDSLVRAIQISFCSASGIVNSMQQQQQRTATDTNKVTGAVSHIGSLVGMRACDARRCARTCVV